jgi:pimeloyl-ACP methyl ester carboxylesterase
MHVLEAGFESGDRPAVLLLHGFPELAFSWRKILPRLADAGFHAIAPDQRGYGRTTGWDPDYDGNLHSYRMLNLVRDAMGLLHALDVGSASVVGHDFGSPVAAWCGMVRPDIFTRVALMSAPFAGPPSISDGSMDGASARADVLADLEVLPRPRKHYQQYYTTRAANSDLWHAPQGVHDLLRAYYHHKSADWAGNRPSPLGAFTAEALAVMPTYYIMDLNKNMAATVAEHMPDEQSVQTNRWLPEDELAVYTAEYSRTGFQGGLNWYRAVNLSLPEQQLFAGRSLEQPSLFISGASDWGVYQNPGALERMESTACADLRGIHLLDGAGHWVQQEQPVPTADLLIDFLAD